MTFMNLILYYTKHFQGIAETYIS